MDPVMMGLPPEFQVYVRVGHRAIRAYQEGYSGAAFAQSVDRSEGEAVYNAIASLGSAGLLDVLRKLPAALLGPEAAGVLQSPQLAAWLDDFVDYGGDDVNLPPAAGPVPVVK